MGSWNNSALSFSLHLELARGVGCSTAFPEMDGPNKVFVVEEKNLNPAQMS